MNKSHNAIITQICLYVWNSNEMFWYYLPENVLEMNPGEKDKGGCITTQQSRAQSKTA